MTLKEITAAALALPLAEQAALAQVLWENLGGGLPVGDERDAIAVARRRDGELANGTVQGIDHGDAMRAARRTFGAGS